MNNEWLIFDVWRVKTNCSGNELTRKIWFTKESESMEYGEKETITNATINCRLRRKYVFDRFWGWRRWRCGSWKNCFFLHKRRITIPANFMNGRERTGISRVTLNTRRRNIETDIIFIIRREEPWYFSLQGHADSEKILNWQKYSRK